MIGAAVTQELVIHLSDIVLRRSTRAIEGSLTMEGLREGRRDCRSGARMDGT